MDALKGMDLAKLKAICRSVLEDDDEQSESESKPEEQESQESRSGNETQDDENGWSPAGNPTYVFNIGASASWPAPSGTSSREKAIARRKEKSDA